MTAASISSSLPSPHIGVAAEALTQDPDAPPGAAAAIGRLGHQLLTADIISPEQLEEALRRQGNMGMKLGETLIRLGFVSEEELLPYIEKRLKVTAVRFRDGMVDPSAVHLIPRDKAEQFDALAMFKVRDTLTVAMADPQNLQLIDEIERITNLRVRPVFANRDSIERMIQRCYEEGFQVDSITADLDQAAVEISEDTVELDLQTSEEAEDGSPIINLVNYLILQALQKNASDIHIEPGRKHTAVRFRIDGQLREVLRPRRDLHAAIVSRVKVIARLDIAEHRMPQDGRVHVVVEGHEVDLRISMLPTVLGEKVVIRVLDKRRLTFNLDELGFAPDLLDQFKLLLAKPHGLILVTGPTGSGKTTTLYSALELIKSVHRNIVTVEDPVEYQLAQINQVMVDEGTGLTFPVALRSILRQDPDVIMVGEIRDSETANVAVQAALTGHLVLSTLHTNDSAGAVTRLLDMDVAGYKVAAALAGVLAQRLVRKVCPRCQTTYYPPAEILEAIHYQGDCRRSFQRGRGCTACFDTGYHGRTGIYELFACDQQSRGLIAQGTDLTRIRTWLKQRNVRTLFDEGVRLAEAGQTSLDEAMRVAFVD